MAGVCRGRTGQRNGPEICARRRPGANPAEASWRRDGSAAGAEADAAAQDFARRRGRRRSSRRALVRHSLGSNVAQHGFDRRRIRQWSRHVRRRPGQGPGGARPRRRQLPGSQGRPSHPTGQGAVSDRGRREEGGCRYGDGGLGGCQVQSARHRGGGHEPSPGAGARDGECRRPGRSASRKGRKCRQE